MFNAKNRAGKIDDEVDSTQLSSQSREFVNSPVELTIYLPGNENDEKGRIKPCVCIYLQTRRRLLHS